MKRKNIIIIVAVVGVILIALGIYAFVISKKETKGKIIARVGNSVLTDEELRRIIPPSLVQSVNPQMIVELWVRRELMYQEAKKRNLDKKDYIKQRLEELKKDLIAQALADEEASKVFVTNDEVRDYFSKHKDEFLYEIKISQIVLGNEIAANEVYEKLKKGADFKSLAKERSIDPMKGEESKYLPRGTIDPGLEEIIFNLSTGEFTKPIQTPDGAWRIIKVVDKKKVKEEAKLEDWEKYIRELLEIRKKQERIARFVDSLRTVYRVEIKPENIFR